MRTIDELNTPKSYQRSPSLNNVQPSAARLARLVDAGNAVALDSDCGTLLYYPLLFILRMSFTDGDSFRRRWAYLYLENYVVMVSRHSPNIGITVELAGLATIANLIFGFSFLPIFWCAK